MVRNKIILLFCVYDKGQQTLDMDSMSHEECQICIFKVVQRVAELRIYGDERCKMMRILACGMTAVPLEYSTVVGCVSNIIANVI